MKITLKVFITKSFASANVTEDYWLDKFSCLLIIRKYENTIYIITAMFYYIACCYQQHHVDGCTLMPVSLTVIWTCNTFFN